MVTTFSSFASLQKSIPWFRQKDLVHSEQDFDRDRRPGDPLCEDSDETVTVESKPKRESENVERRRREFDEEPEESPLGPNGMIVLFLKQVHLQKVGAAGWSHSISI